MTRLAARDVHVRIGGRDILREVTFSTQPGEMLGVIGPNGAGKSTLLRVLAGLLPLTRGTAAWGDFQITGRDMRALARLRAYVGQQAPEASLYTVGEMLTMGLAHKHRWFSLAPNPAAMQAALRRVDAGCAQETGFARLSGGEQQQVLVARALLAQAPLLVLDEPTAHLDLRHRGTVMQALKQEQKRGATCVVSLHDLNAAGAYCDRILVLHEGRMAALGTPDEVLTEAALSRVFATPLWCGRHPATNKPAVEARPQGATRLTSSSQSP